MCIWGCLGSSGLWQAGLHRLVKRVLSLGNKKGDIVHKAHTDTYCSRCVCVGRGAWWWRVQCVKLSSCSDRDP
jgi:hypothetical protein